MRTNKVISFVMLLLLTAVVMQAQERNTLYIPDMDVEAGKNFQMPVYVDNTNLNITALQFTINIPKGVTINPYKAKQTERAADHKLSYHQNADTLWTIMLYSNANKPLIANAGIVLNIPALVNDTVKEGSIKPLSITKVVLSDSIGKNVLTDYSCGNINVVKTPDFIVTDVVCDVTTINPEDSINIEWKVKNIGGVASTGGWRERVFLVSNKGDEHLLNSYYVADNILTPEEGINRKVGIRLPRLLGADGKGNIKVELIPNSDSGERVANSGNNTAESNKNAITINKRLYLTVPKRMHEPKKDTQLQISVERSGSWKNELPLTFTLEGDNRVKLPSQNSISKSSSTLTTYLTISDDNKLNEDSLFTISVSAKDYETVSCQMVIIDNDLPQLTLNGNIKELREGETMLMTITNQIAPENPLTINISSNLPTMLKHPETIVMEAGKNTASFAVKALQDTEITDILTAEITVTAQRHQSGSSLFFFIDDDMPELNFELKPQTVSEVDGPACLIGKITRETNIDSNITIRLSDDSNGQLYYSNNELEMKAGVRVCEFTMGTIDNEFVDGTRQFTVTAAVYIPKCSCTAKSNSNSSVSLVITVTDDDGPALKVKSAVTSILEGAESILIISHNTNSDRDVTVTLSSDADEELEYDHMVTIPIGQQSVDVTVKLKKNDIKEDNRLVVFTVEADEYAPATCWLQLTDQTMPDAIISNFSVTPQSAEVNQSVTVSTTISNTGNDVLPPLTRVNLYLNKKQLTHFFTDSAISIGEDLTISHEIRLPATPGKYEIYAVVNENKDVVETVYLNNRSTIAKVNAVAPFTAQIIVDKETYKHGETVNISGKATGNNISKAEVEVYIQNGFFRHTIITKTDEEGNFTVTFTPMSRQVGHFTAGACYPGEDLQEEMASFDVYGISVEGSREVDLQWELGKIKTGEIKIKNENILPQTGLKVEQTATSENCVFTFEAPKIIASKGTAIIKYAIKSNAVSEGTDWQTMPIIITTNEGAEINYLFNYYVHDDKAHLKTNTTYINTTMVRNSVRNYPIVVSNQGFVETGRIKLSLPNWIKTATPTEIASLTPGDSTTIILQFCPTDNMLLNEIITGHFGINCENGSGIPVYFSITPVSESKGKLTVDVVDEFTFNTNEMPHVDNAVVQIKHLVTDQIIAEKNTGSDGKCNFELTEGQYKLEVKADNHESYSNILMVDPEIEKRHEAFLSYNAVTYEFEVEETEVEDVYEIETVVKYDVSVPKPILLVSLPNERPINGSVIPITVTNKGFIETIDVNVILASTDNYEIDFLNEPHLDKLSANETEVFYARFASKTASSRKAEAEVPSNYECQQLAVQVRGYYLCGDYYSNPVTGLAEKAWGQCLDINNGKSTIWNYFGGRAGNGGGGNGEGNYKPGPSDPQKDVDYDFVLNSSNDEYEYKKKICNELYPYNPTNHDNPNAPDDPINLSIVSDAEPDKQPCTSEEEPILVYRLVPVNGKRYDMKGVAADGVSQVKIVLDPKESRIPEDGCDNITNVKWELSRNLGKIEGNSLHEAIYTAPDSFPGNIGSVAIVEASVRYSQRTTPIVTWGRHSAPVKIEIIRPPLLIVHGLFDDEHKWKALEESFSSKDLNNPYYPKNINYRLNYDSTKTHSVYKNYPAVGSGILKVQHRALAQGYVATKCDVLGFGQGGILARLHVQNGGTGVNKLITMNTPHAGSEWADGIEAHRIIFGNILRLYFLNTNIDAIYDLGVNSNVINRLNAQAGLNLYSDIPVHAMATQDGVQSWVGTQGLGTLLDFGGNVAGAFGPIGVAIGVVAKYFSHFYSDDWSQVGSGDGYVSTASQVGGCTANTIQDWGYRHKDIPKYAKSDARLHELLLANKNDPCFSKDWFNPEVRYFDHENWLIQMIKETLVEKIGGWGVKKLMKGNDVIHLFKIGDKSVKIMASELIPSGGVSTYNFVRNAGVYITHKGGANARSMNESVKINDGEKNLFFNMNKLDGYSEPLTIVCYGEDSYAMAEGDSVNIKVPSSYTGDAKIMVYMRGNDGNVYCQDYLYTIDEPMASPISLTLDEMTINVGENEALRLYCTWDDGSETKVVADNVGFETTGVARYEGGKLIGVKQGYSDITATYAGLKCTGTIRVFDTELTTDDEDDETSENVCSTVSLSFKQEMVMTRQAFRGTLTINNGYANKPLEDVKINLVVSDAEGNIASAHEFQITPESLEGFEGELDFGAGWTLGAKESGKATILFIPTKCAAETASKEWSFGGTFSYKDPISGLTLTNSLYPVTLTVNPTPDLIMDYFMQRDVMGDDPLTEEIIEPTIPAEFSLLIQNKGYGDATNVKMITNQPEIVDNEKGLLIDFELLSSQLNGGEKTLALGQSVATDFGTIEAGKTVYAQWWLTSSLMGHFSEYDVKATHVTSYGNPDLSLIDTVRIHELIHTLSIPNADTPGWLVNDIKDSQDLPDMLYLSDGTKETVSLATAIVHETDNNVYTLTVTPRSETWNYGSVVDPTAGQKLLGSVVRQSDGMEMSLHNFWQTDRTLRDGKDPLYEFRLHFADKIQGATEKYLLTFVERPANVTIILDEDDTILPTASNGNVNVDVKRTIKANEWSTICLPFAMNEQQVNSAFGEDAQLCDFDGYEVLDNGSTISVKFRTVTSIEANHPYIIKVTEAINEFSVSNVVVIPQEKPIKNLGTEDCPKAMVGNYINGTTLKNGALFISDGKFYYSVGKTKIQGFRAFFDFDDKVIDFNANARIVMTIDGLNTTIDKTTQSVIANEKSNKTYNLSGQRVIKPGKGVYIINGKKMVVK